MANVGPQPFSHASRDVQSDSSLGSGWVTQGHPKSSPEAAPLSGLSCIDGCPFGGTDSVTIVFLVTFLDQFPFSPGCSF